MKIDWSTKNNMTLKELQDRNPQIPLFGIEDEAFAEYGRIIRGMDVQDIMVAGDKIKLPETGTIYEPSVSAFESMPIAERIRKECFGELPIQMGYCYGHSSLLNGWEWHSSSEVNIAITDMVLILGKRSDFRDGKIDTATAKAFLLKEGDAVEVYATTLHFCPCQVTESGFGCVVALPAGTNVPLEEKFTDPLLFRKNKWIVAHIENTDLIAKGVIPGIVGGNLEIKY